ncbi:hypothetical protein [Streptomyces lavendofoliae]|uniref:hypothetical protein n=1 Tax=Streptomyces lavendofoliae TaxID=67314 RepID=UPI003D8CC89D
MESASLPLGAGRSTLYRNPRRARRSRRDHRHTPHAPRNTDYRINLVGMIHPRPEPDVLISGATERSTDDLGSTGKVKKDGRYLTTANVERSSVIGESDGTRFVAPGGKVLVGRAHEGDENGDTYYYYADVLDNEGNKLEVVPGEWHSIREIDSVFVAPSNHVIIGRCHTGDEDRVTEYLTATLR